VVFGQGYYKAKNAMEQTSQQMLMKFPGEATYKLSSGEFSLWAVGNSHENSAQCWSKRYFILFFSGL